MSRDELVRMAVEGESVTGDVLMKKFTVFG